MSDGEHGHPLFGAPFHHIQALADRFTVQDRRWFADGARQGRIEMFRGLEGEATGGVTVAGKIVQGGGQERR